MYRSLINFYSIFFSFFFTTISLAQDKLIIKPPEHIKSIIVRAAQTNNYSPIIKLGQSFNLEFDDLNSTSEQYTYKIEHFDYNWEPSGLSSTEFINGYDNDWIREFENSFNTFQPYTHYSVQIPNNNTAIKISGNYLISIFNENNEPVFSRPIIIYESMIDVGVSLHRSRDISSLNSKQNVQFVVNAPNLRINNPSQEIKVAIFQNNDWNTVIKDLKPQYYRGSQLIYKYIDKISFWGANEYLYFDTKQIRSESNRVARSELLDLFETYLYTDEARVDRPYTLSPDINGNFVIRTVDGGTAATEADYTWVHFTLDPLNANIQGPVYIYGNFNAWQLTEENQMAYDEELQLYSAKLLLKQGFYNYIYVTENKDISINNAAIGGSFFQTENDYSVLIYYRPIGSRFDQIIGFGQANSENLRN